MESDLNDANNDSLESSALPHGTADSHDQLWECSFDDVWNRCVTAADMSKDTEWVQDIVKQYDKDNSALPIGTARDDKSLVSTAQGNARLGMTFNMPEDMSTIRCYENEMY